MFRSEDLNQTIPEIHSLKLSNINMILLYSWLRSDEHLISGFFITYFSTALVTWLNVSG